MNKFFTKESISNLVNEDRQSNFLFVENKGATYTLYLYTTDTYYQVVLMCRYLDPFDNKYAELGLDEIIALKAELKTRPFSNAKSSLYVPIINMLAKHKLLDESK